LPLEDFFAWLGVPAVAGEAHAGLPGTKKEIEPVRRRVGRPAYSILPGSSVCSDAVRQKSTNGVVQWVKQRIDLLLNIRQAG